MKTTFPHFRLSAGKKHIEFYLRKTRDEKKKNEKPGRDVPSGLRREFKYRQNCFQNSRRIVIRRASVRQKDRKRLNSCVSTAAANFAQCYGTFCAQQNVQMRTSKNKCVPLFCHSKSLIFHAMAWVRKILFLTFL